MKFLADTDNLEIIPLENTSIEGIEHFVANWKSYRISSPPMIVFKETSLDEGYPPDGPEDLDYNYNNNEIEL